MGTPEPWWSKKWWWPNCCCDDCWIFMDDCYEKIGVPRYWWEPLGSPYALWFSHDGSEATGESGYFSSDGFIIATTEISENPYNSITAGKFQWSTYTEAGDAYLVCDYVDSDNFHWVEFSYDETRSGDTVEIKFWDRASGTDTQIGGTLTIDDDDVDGFPTLWLVVCKSTTKMTLNVYSGSIAWEPFAAAPDFFAEAEITDKGGTRSGAGMKGGGPGFTATPDDWGIRLKEFHLERTDDEDSGCDICNRYCCTDTTPLEFDVTFSGFADESGGDCGNCDDLNTTFTIVFDGDVASATQTPPGGTCKWEYSAGYGAYFWECDPGIPFTNYKYDTITLQLAYIDPNQTKWTLTIYEFGSTQNILEFTYTVSGWLPTCALDGTESWTLAVDNDSCDHNNVDVSVAAQ